jgi:hypothetical protein
MPIRDTRMMARALEQRWPMTPEVRKAVVGRLIKVLTDPESKKREVIAASKALMAAEAQNQEDEHKVLDVRVATRNDRLDAIAADLGIDPSVIEAATREAGSGVGSDAIDSVQDDGTR